MESTRTEKATTSYPDARRPPSRAPERDAPWRKRYRIARRNLGGAILGRLAPTILSRLSRSWSVDVLGAEHLASVEQEPGRLLALWHGRMLLGVTHHAGRSYTILVSPSDDGSLVARLLERFDYRVIRGSTNQRNVPSLHAMVGELRTGGTVVITPDGPRGPRHGMNPGLAWMSRVTGFPILPVGFACDRAWRFSSWDRFTIPKRRARVAIVYGEPVRVSTEASEAEQEAATACVRDRLLEAERLGFAHLGVASDVSDETGERS